MKEGMFNPEEMMAAESAAVEDAKKLNKERAEREIEALQTRGTKKNILDDVSDKEIEEGLKGLE